MKQNRTVGSIVRIPLSDGTHTYAQVLREADFAFFDSRCTEDLPIETVVARTVLFRVAVYSHAITKGRWTKVGKAAIPTSLSQPQRTFIQDPLNPSRFQIYVGGVITEASREACTGLERCAVWEPEHVEERIRDHYAGRANRWAESLRIQEPPNPALQRTRFARR